jgi:hypothetical protein
LSGLNYKAALFVNLLHFHVHADGHGIAQTDISEAGHMLPLQAGGLLAKVCGVLLHVLLLR